MSLGCRTSTTPPRQLSEAWIFVNRCGLWISSGTGLLLALALIGISACFSPLQEDPGNALDLGAAIAWSASGWPEWSLYVPVFQQVLGRGWRPVPLMFSGHQSKALLETGWAAVLDANALEALQPETALSSAQRTEVEELSDLSMFLRNWSIIIPTGMTSVVVVLVLISPELVVQVSSGPEEGLIHEFTPDAVNQSFYAAVSNLFNLGRHRRIAYN